MGSGGCYPNKQVFKFMIDFLNFPAGMSQFYGFTFRLLVGIVLVLTDSVGATLRGCFIQSMPTFSFTDYVRQRSLSPRHLITTAAQSEPGGQLGAELAADGRAMCG